jgi:taurine--2-oxoglutarate transaminase
MKPEIAARYNDTVYQGGLTYTSHPISLAAAIANIKVMQDDHLIEHTEKMGPVLHKLLTDLGEQHPSVGEVRSIGLFGAIELVRNRVTKEPMAPYNGTSSEMIMLRKKLFEKGLFIDIHWHTLLIIPPLIITNDQLEEGFEILDEALNITDEIASR